MGKKRELDSITPDFNLTDEQIEDLRRIVTDSEYAEMIAKQQAREHEEYIMRLRNMAATGIDDDGRPIPMHIVKKLRVRYETLTGERLNVDEK